MHIYNRLRDLREDENLTQKEFAKKMNLTQQQYSEYERGKREIPFFKIVEIAQYYRVSIDYIAGRTNDKKGLTRSDLPEEQARIIRSYKNLSEKRQGILIGVLKQLEAEQNEENAKRKDAV